MLLECTNIRRSETAAVVISIFLVGKQGKVP